MEQSPLKHSSPPIRMGSPGANLSPQRIFPRHRKAASTVTGAMLHAVALERKKKGRSQNSMQSLPIRRLPEGTSLFYVVSNGDKEKFFTEDDKWSDFFIDLKTSQSYMIPGASIKLPPAEFRQIYVYELTEPVNLACTFLEDVSLLKNVDRFPTMDGLYNEWETKLGIVIETLHLRNFYKKIKFIGDKSTLKINKKVDNKDKVKGAVTRRSSLSRIDLHRDDSVDVLTTPKDKGNETIKE